MGNAAADAKLAMAGALLSAAQNVQPPCQECIDAPELQAAILFPALGTPFVACNTDTKIRLFLLVEDKCLDLFGIRAMGQGKTAPLAWFVINRHLRLLPFDDPKTSADVKNGGLYTSDGAAMAGIQVYYHGTYAHGYKSSATQWGDLIYDHLGNAVATLRPSSVKFFVEAQAGYGAITSAHDVDPNVADVNNNPLRHLFEIELDRTGLINNPSPDTSYTLAWMVTCVYAKATGPNGQPVLPGVTHWEHQDKLIYDFLAMMGRNKQHFAKPFEFNVDEADVTHWPSQYADEAHRLKSYHPVVFKSCDELAIGHLSDVHISSRHFALASSLADLIPGQGEQPWPKLANSFIALRDLFGAMRSQGADALFLTGDLIDFNHNLNPTKFDGATPAEQWSTFKLSSYFDGGHLKPSGADVYPRALDDMLAYSLVKSSYLKGCPVFMVTGNHEAYDVPYGVSPRLNYAANRAGTDDAIAIDQQNRKRERIAAEADELDKAGQHEAAQKKREELAESERDARTTAVTPLAGATLTLASAATTVSGWFKSEEDKRQDAYVEDKANEGVPADHNLTIYEAWLAYGPTAGVVLKPWNFVPANYDWFFMVFTPLADFCLDYGSQQRLIGLDWGESEVMVNLDPTEGKLAGVLPRANKSLHDGQRQLIAEGVATSGARKNVLFSHFTIINYDSNQAYRQEESWYTQPPGFQLHDKAYSDYNVGTFGQHREWLFGFFNGQAGRGCIHYTLAGHSHRAGAYAITFDQGSQVAASHDAPNATPQTWLRLQAFEPSTQAEGHSDDHAKLYKDTATTRVLVSSCGGPVGVQNHQGELHGMNLKPPSGTLLRTALAGQSGEFIRVASDTVKPRFCVALDYIVMMKKKQPIAWRATGKPGVFIMRTGEVVGATEDFVDNVTFYVADGKSEGFSEILQSSNGAAKEVQDGFEREVSISSEGAELMKSVSISGGKVEGALLCKVTFKPVLEGSLLYGCFDFSSPWIFPVSFHGGFPSRQEGRYGEVPNFDWLQKKIPEYYGS